MTKYYWNQAASKNALTRFLKIEFSISPFYVGRFYTNYYFIMLTHLLRNTVVFIKDVLTYLHQVDFFHPSKLHEVMSIFRGTLFIFYDFIANTHTRSAVSGLGLHYLSVSAVVSARHKWINA